MIYLLLMGCSESAALESATPEVFPTPKTDTNPPAPTGPTELDCDAAGGIGTVWTGTETPVPVIVWEHSDDRWLQPDTLEFDPSKQSIVWRLSGSGATCLAWGL